MKPEWQEELQTGVIGACKSVRLESPRLESSEWGGRGFLLDIAATKCHVGVECGRGRWCARLQSFHGLHWNRVSAVRKAQAPGQEGCRA